MYSGLCKGHDERVANSAFLKEASSHLLIFKGDKTETVRNEEGENAVFPMLCSLLRRS